MSGARLVRLGLTAAVLAALATPAESARNRNTIQASYEEAFCRRAHEPEVDYWFGRQDWQTRDHLVVAHRTHLRAWDNARRETVAAAFLGTIAVPPPSAERERWALDLAARGRTCAEIRVVIRDWLWDEYTSLWRGAATFREEVAAEARQVFELAEAADQQIRAGQLAAAYTLIVQARAVYAVAQLKVSEIQAREAAARLPAVLRIRLGYIERSWSYYTAYAAKYGMGRPHLNALARYRAAYTEAAPLIDADTPRAEYLLERAASELAYVKSWVDGRSERRPPP